MRNKFKQPIGTLVFCDGEVVRVEVDNKLHEGPLLKLSGQQFALRVSEFVEGLLEEGVRGHLNLH